MLPKGYYFASCKTHSGTKTHAILYKVGGTQRKRTLCGLKWYEITNKPDRNFKYYQNQCRRCRYDYLKLID